LSAYDARSRAFSHPATSAEARAPSTNDDHNTSFHGQGKLAREALRRRIQRDLQYGGVQMSRMLRDHFGAASARAQPGAGGQGLHVCINTNVT
jgi:hypothetical protein